MKPWHWLFLTGAGILLSAFSPVVGEAQGVLPSTAGMGTSDGTPPGLRTNVFANPHYNPFMNPYAARGQVSRDELMLYFLAARQAKAAQANSGMGAIATGRRASARPPLPDNSRSAEMPYRLMSPGGTASSFFQRQEATKPGAQGLYGQYYGRYGRHFDHNGR